MLLKYFNIRIANSEQAYTAFIREHQLLTEVNNIDPCHKCGSEMCEKQRKNRNGEFVPIFRCPKILYITLMWMRFKFKCDFTGETNKTYVI